jgi:hypothetical protein
MIDEMKLVDLPPAMAAQYSPIVDGLDGLPQRQYSPFSCFYVLIPNDIPQIINPVLSLIVFISDGIKGPVWRQNRQS